MPGSGQPKAPSDQVTCSARARTTALSATLKRFAASATTARRSSAGIAVVETGWPSGWPLSAGAGIRTGGARGVARFSSPEAQAAARAANVSIARNLAIVCTSARQCINAAPATKGFMKYRHQYHAGNFADVHKHVLLLDVLDALTRKDKGLLFVDTHAGRGGYSLHPGDAQHPQEWQSGVAR